jgi:hypothetical protein
MSFFEVTKEDIGALGDGDVRELVARLAERHLVINGHPRSAVTAGGHQDAPDGGIDVRVTLASGTVTGFVPRAQTGFQVKATGMRAAEIRNEMRPSGALRPSIQALAAAGGAYVIVASKDNPTDSQLRERCAAMREALGADPELAGLHVDFYGQDRLAQWVNEHPGIIAWVHECLGRPFGGWKPFQDWSSSPQDTAQPYLLDDGLRLSNPARSGSAQLSAEAGLTEVRRLLAEPGAAVRLVGLSGVGKTRFAQALFDDCVGEGALDPNSAVYGDLGTSLDPQPEHLVERLRAFGRKFVLIVDNCGWSLHNTLAKAIKAKSAPISLLTIEYEVTDDESEGTDVFRLDAASEELIETLLKRRRPDLSGLDRKRIAEFSGGNFRIALALAHTTGKGDSVASLRDGDLLDRLLFQRQPKDDALRHAAGVLSLVYSLDCARRDGDGAELPLLASLAHQSPAEFFRHITVLQDRGLVQRRGEFRALLPHAIAHRLAKGALERIHLDQIRHDFIDRAPERLLKSFSRRLGYLHESQEAQAIVREWLADERWLAHAERLNDLGLTLLENVAPVDPQAVLEAIARALERAGAVGFESEHVPRLLRLLRSLAYEPEQFEAAARQIGAFACRYAEEDGSHRALDDFSELFHVVLSGTLAGPGMRARLVRSLAGSADPADQALALRALSAMLHCGRFSSSHSFEFGTRRRDYGYHPRTDDDWWAWFASTFALCRDLDARPELSARVRRLVAEKMPWIVRSIGVTSELEALARTWAGNSGWPEGWVACRTALQLLRGARASDEARLAALLPVLEPRDLGDRIRVYVLPAQGSVLDPLMLADSDDPTTFQQAGERIEAECIAIGKALATDRAALAHHLPSLLAHPGGRAFHVGLGLARAVADPAKAWRSAVAAFRALPSAGRSPNLLGGMIKGIADRDRAVADALLTEALRDPDLQHCFVWLQCAVGLDEAGVARIVEATHLSAIPTVSFSTLGYGRVCDTLPAGQMAEILDAIATRDDGPDVAVHVFGMRLLGLRQQNARLQDVEKQAGLRLLSRVRFAQSRNDGGYRVAEIASACLDAEADEAAARDLLTRFAEAEKAGRTSFTGYQRLLTFFAERFPFVLLDVLIDPDNGEAEAIRQLRWSVDDDSRNIFARIGDRVLLNWAAERPDRRAPALAAVIPLWKASLSGTREGTGPLAWTDAALKLLRLPDDPRSVLNAFFDRLHPGAWWGSLSDHLVARLPLLEELARHGDSRVARWAADATVRFRREIHREQAREGESRRERDERFDW